jgi:hypothetical protein
MFAPIGCFQELLYVGSHFDAHLTTLFQDIWLLGRAMCLLVPYIELTVSHSSVLIILAITIER